MIAARHTPLPTVAAITHGLDLSAATDPTADPRCYNRHRVDRHGSFHADPQIRAAIDRVSPGRAGLMGGLVNTVMQICAALAVAVLGGLFFFVPGPGAEPAAISHAFTVTLTGIGCMHLLGALLAAGLGQTRYRRAAALRATEACPPS